MTLNELNNLEQEILSQLQKLDRLGGTIEEKTARLAENGIFRNYTQIHKSYINLIKTGNREISLEALKRALYIQWIGSFEPSFITGIITAFETYEENEEGLELRDFEFVYDMIDKAIQDGIIDKELNDMLSYYAGWDFLFKWNGFEKFNALNKFIKGQSENNQNAYLLIKQRDLDNRGQMGEYFKGLGE